MLTCGLVRTNFSFAIFPPETHLTGLHVVFIIYLFKKFIFIFSVFILIFSIVIVVFLFFSFHYSSTAQEGLITCKDTVNIRFRAENRIMALQDRMNFITWGSTTKQDFDESYTTATKGQARLFYNDSVIISNDVDPQLIISNKRNENLYVKMYLNQLYSGYQKNDDDENTIFLFILWNI